MNYEYRRPPDDRPPPPSFALWKTLLLLVTGSGLTLALVTLASLWQTGNWVAARLGSLRMATRPAAVDVRSIVVQQVQEVNDLTTAVFTMQAVVPTSQSAEISGVVIGQTKLLYVAYGEVRAGVNLDELKPEQVTVQGDHLQIQLPPPRILDRKIDVDRSSVYDYNRGFLGLGPDVGPELQAAAQQRSLQQITEAACREGLLQQANDRAQLAITKLMTTAGYKTVTVRTQPPLSHTCGLPQRS